MRGRPENRIVVSDTLDTQHPLIAAAEQGVATTEEPVRPGLPTAKGRTLDNAVNEASLPCARRIMEATVR